MQEEVTQKTIALSMKTGKLTAQALQAALKKYLQHRAKGPKLHHGKQSLKQLKAHGAALTNIEVTKANIGAFKPCAKKYGVDFTLLLQTLVPVCSGVASICFIRLTLTRAENTSAISMKQLVKGS